MCCANCGIGIPKSSGEFCSERCRRDSTHSILNHEVDPMAMFNLLGEAIIQAFIGASSRDPENRVSNREFIMSKEVSMWCDCSENFNQKRLLGYYDKFIKSI